MENRISNVQESFMNRLSLMFEQSGASPLLGRICGLLCFSSTPISLQEIAEATGVSKAAVSMQIRVLERSGFCNKLPRGNDRKDYYTIADDFGLRIANASVAQMLAMLSLLQQTLNQFPQKQEVSKEDHQRYHISKSRLREMEAFYQLLQEKLGDIESEWAERIGTHIVNS